MNSTLHREAMERKYAERSNPSKEMLAKVAVAMMDASSVLLFLSETFDALDSGQVDMNLSSGAAGGLSLICRQVAGDLLDTYGTL